MFHVTNLEYSCRGFFSTRYIKNTITVTQLAQRKKKNMIKQPPIPVNEYQDRYAKTQRLSSL